MRAASDVSRAANISEGSPWKEPSQRGHARVQNSAQAKHWQLCECLNSWWPRFVRAKHAFPAALGIQLSEQAALRVLQAPWPRYSRLQVWAGDAHFRLLGCNLPCFSRPVHRGTPGQDFSGIPPNFRALSPLSTAARPEKGRKRGNPDFYPEISGGERKPSAAVAAFPPPAELSAHNIPSAWSLARSMQPSEEDLGL